MRNDASGNHSSDYAKQADEGPNGSILEEFATHSGVDDPELIDELKETTGGDIVIDRAPTPEKPRGAYVECVPADAYDLPSLQTYIQRRHGGGEYSLRPRVKGRFLKGCKIVVCLDDPKQPEGQARETGPAPGASPGQAQAQPLATQSPPDRMGDLVKMLALAAPLAPVLQEAVKGFFSRPRSEAPQGLTLADCVMLMKVTSNKTDPVEQMIRIQEFQRSMREDLEPRSAMSDMLPQLLAGLGSLAGLANAGQAQPAPAVQASPLSTQRISQAGPRQEHQAAPAAPQDQAKRQPTEHEAETMERIKRLIAILEGLARKNADAEDCALAISLTASDDELVQIEALIQKESNIKMLMLVAPTLRPHADWVNRIAAELPAKLAELRDETPGDAGQGSESDAQATAAQG